MFRELIHAQVRGIWRRIPTELRQSAFRGFVSSFRPSLAPANAAVKSDTSVPKIVVGFLSSPSGLGQSARLAAAAFRAEGYTVFGIDLGGYFYEGRSFVAHDLPDGWGCRGLAHVLIVINAPYLSFGLFLLGRSFLRHKHVTGYWAWELPKVPEEWKPGFSCVHDVAVPSTFVGESVFASGFAGSITIAPHPVELDHPPAWTEIARRDSTTFTVASIANVGSGFARKNPLALIRAFRLACEGNRSRQLNMLLIGSEQYPESRRMVLDAIGAAQNIEVRWTPLERHDLYRWWSAADAFALLHRSEGFGLPLAEAMCSGYPVIATGWSGNMDFMTSDISFPVRFKLVSVDDPQLKYRSADGMWAEPDIYHAAEAIEVLARNRELGIEVGKKARAALLSTLTAARFVGQLATAEPSLVRTAHSVD